MGQARIRTAAAKEKARKQLLELLEDPTIVQSLVFARNEKDEWTVLCHGVKAFQMGQALLIGTEAMQILMDREKEVDGPTGGPVRLDFSAPTDAETGEPAGRRRKPECTTDAEGNIIPPKGEQWMGCAECGGNRWYATTCDDGAPGREVCIRCGNEIKNVRVWHPEGQA